MGGNSRPVLFLWNLHLFVNYKIVSFLALLAFYSKLKIYNRPELGKMVGKLEDFALGSLDVVGVAADDEFGWFPAHGRPYVGVGTLAQLPDHAAWVRARGFERKKNKNR